MTGIGRSRPQPGLGRSHRVGPQPRWWGVFALVIMPAVILAGCATPVGLKPAGLRGAHLETSAYALSEASPSYSTIVVLQRYGLSERYEKDPQPVLDVLHRTVTEGDDRRDLRFALAELSFLFGETLETSASPEQKAKAPDYYLTAALHAYLFLMGESREAPPGPYDNRFREACDIHNRALGKGLATGGDGRVVLRDGLRKLPSGPLSLSIDTSAFEWDLNAFDRILCSDDYLVHGFTVRNRTAGLGVPLIAVNTSEKQFSGKRVVPLTAFLRLPPGGGESASGPLQARLELYAGYDDLQVSVDGRSVPLESDSTAGIAYALDDPVIWSQGMRRFLRIREQIQPQLVMSQPYQRGRIPVVFVHGTASDLVWWAEMLNTLRGDAQLRRRYQFWFFRYNSSRPILDSAEALRRILTETRQAWDPDGTDPAMDQMVIIGHSQGGLLTKMTVVHTGDLLWRSLSDTPFDEANLPPDGRELARRWLFFEPLPFVKRVVFISTPHRGSFLAGQRIGNLFRKLLDFPADMIYGAASIMTMSENWKLPYRFEGRIPTSLDGMSPENPILKALAAIPPATGVTAHSIIAVKGEGDPAEGDDGVVAYQSAHLEDVASEFIVRSGHSCQEHPLTIEEVRRILLEHLE
jgi:pimeloyl-ACP methyl ester carboxylesterase